MGAIRVFVNYGDIVVLAWSLGFAMLSFVNRPDQPPQSPQFKPGSAWYYRKRSQMIPMVAVSVALIGFVVYGCWKLNEPWTITAICLSVPALWLVLGVGSYLRYGYLAKKISAEDTE